MKQPARILVVTNGYPNRYKPYAGMYLKRHVQLHREAGLEVTVLTHGDSRHGIFRSSRKYLYLLLRVLKAMLWSNFDLVHAHWVLPSGLLGTVVSRFKNVPLVITSHGAFTDAYSSHPWLIRQLVRFVLRSANRVITVGQYQKREVERIADLPSDHVHWIPMGVWMEDVPPDKQIARERLGLDNERKIVVFIGNLLWCKGPDVLVRAAAHLLNSGGQFDLVVGGQGQMLANLRRQVETLQISTNVKLLGGVLPGEAKMWLSAADVCVIPSRTEAFGLVAIEAMACGTPVVAANVGGLAETIRHGENGFLFPVDDHRALADLLGQLLDDEDLRNSVIEAGYQTAAIHDMRLKAEQVKQIYEQLLGE